MKFDLPVLLLFGLVSLGKGGERRKEKGVAGAQSHACFLIEPAIAQMILFSEIQAQIIQHLHTTAIC